MKLRILPESFITNGINISNSNNCLICSEVLKKYNETILENSEGCIFKIDFINELIGLHITEYVNCIEFTAPKGTIILSNNIFEKLLIDFHSEYYLEIDVFVPPQATKVIFKIENREIFNKSDIKNFLETGIDKKYKFLQLNQCIKVESIELTIKELEPYSVCLINNTDLEVEFDIPKEPEEPKVPVTEETIVNTTENIVNTFEPKHLSREELRNARLKFYKSKSKF